jgi:hypothetical protein
VDAGRGLFYAKRKSCAMLQQIKRREKFYETLEIFDRDSGGSDLARFRLSGQCAMAWSPRGLARPSGMGLAWIWIPIWISGLAMGRWNSRSLRRWDPILGMGLSVRALWLRLLSLCLCAGLCTAGLSGTCGHTPAAGRREGRSERGRVGRKTEVRDRPSEELRDTVRGQLDRPVARPRPNRASRPKRPEWCSCTGRNSHRCS